MRCFQRPFWLPEVLSWEDNAVDKGGTDGRNSSRKVTIGGSVGQGKYHRRNGF